MIIPPVPPMTLPETIFGVMVLTGFAAFAITLAGVHLYVSLPPRRRRIREIPDSRPAPPIDALRGQIL